MIITRSRAKETLPRAPRCKERASYHSIWRRRRFWPHSSWPARRGPARVSQHFRHCLSFARRIPLCPPQPGRRRLLPMLPPPCLQQSFCRRSGWHPPGPLEQPRPSSRQPSRRFRLSGKLDTLDSATFFHLNLTLTKHFQRHTEQTGCRLYQPAYPNASPFLLQTLRGGTTPAKASELQTATWYFHQPLCNSGRTG